MIIIIIINTSTSIITSTIDTVPIIVIITNN